MIAEWDFDTLLDPISSLYEVYNQSVINDIARRLAKLDMTASAAWQMQRLTESGKVYTNALDELSGTMHKSQTELRTAFQKAGVHALKFDDAIYAAAGLQPMPLNLSGAMAEVLAAGLRKTHGIMQNICMTAPMEGQRAFENTADLAYEQVVNGAFSYTEAIKGGIKRLANEGITVVQYPGHEEQIDVAMRRAVLSGVAGTVGNLQITRAREMKTDLVQTSAHIFPRPTHAIWQGQIFSLSGTDKKYPSFVAITDYGSVTGICGANCRHTFYPWFLGISENMYTKAILDSYARKTVKYNGKEMTGYEASQIQRSIERRIRAVKREAAALGAAGQDNGEELAKVHTLQAKMRDFVDQTGLDRQNVREGGRVARVEAAPVVPSKSEIQAEWLKKETAEDIWKQHLGNEADSHAEVLQAELERWKPGRAPEVWTSFDGKVKLTEILDDQREVGTFWSRQVQIEGDGVAVLKDDNTTFLRGWGDEKIFHGFARRDVMAYQLDKALGTDVVPKTVPFISNGQYYSLQDFVPDAQVGDNAIHDAGNVKALYDSLADKTEPGKIMLLDYITQHDDRHSLNWLVDADMHLHAIDNSLMMKNDNPDVYTYGVWGQFAFYQADNHGVFELPASYQVTLEKLISSGKLEAILRTAKTGDKAADEVLVRAAMARATWVDEHWSELFRDTP